MMIRDATKDDISQILDLLYDLGRPRPNNDSDVKIFKKQMQKYIADSDKIVLVAVYEEKIIGVATVMLLPRLNQIEPEMYIPELIVLKKHQRKKIGKKLVQSCIKLARKNKCHRIRLESGNQRRESHEFYLSLGFTQSALSFSMNL